MPIETLANLNCQLVGPRGGPSTAQAVMIFCHGFGASGDDLVPLAGELIRLSPSLRDNVLFVFPEAPLSVPEVPAGRAWWPIDMLALQQAAQRRDFRQMRQETPPLLSDARQKLLGLVEALQERTGLPLSQFVLGGFSQGSMLAVDVAIRLDANVGGLIVYSGTLLAESEWRKLSAGHRGLHVVQSHGTYDPLLPFDAALLLRDMLEDAGADVEFISFDGVHTIPAEAVAATARMLTRLVAPENGTGQAVIG